MAKEVVLVPKEKYQKLLEDRMIMNNRCKTNPSKIDGDFEEKKSISDPNNINLETDLYNKEKSQPDTECGDKSVDQNFNKRTYNNLQNADTEEVLESVHHDTLNGKAGVNQSEALQTTEAYRDKSDDSVIKLAVRSTPTSIVNRRKVSASRRKTYRKKWLKYK